MGSWLVSPAHHTAALRKAGSTSVSSGPPPDAKAPEPAEVPPEYLPAKLGDAQRRMRLSSSNPGSVSSDLDRHTSAQPLEFLSLPNGLGAKADRQLLPEEPHFFIQLSDEEIAELRDERVVAATHYGPSAQDKASNEDFALGGVMQVRGREFAFVALADGVSTKTFWAARTARIACLTTYRTIKKLLDDGLDLGRPDAGAQIAQAVAPAIEEQLKEDAAILEQAGAIPRDWSPEIYAKHKTNHPMWYRSTLLFGVAGEPGAVVGFAGDGGIRQFVQPERGTRQLQENTILASEEGVDLEHYVSLSFSPKEIITHHLPGAGRARMHLIFATDGLDKTLHGLRPSDPRQGSRYLDLPLGTRAQAFGFLAEIAQHKATDLDNLSVARLSWPLAAKSNPWPVRRHQEPLSRWQLAPPQAHDEPQRAIAPGAAPQPAPAPEGSTSTSGGKQPKWLILFLVAGLFAVCALALSIVALRELAEEENLPSSAAASHDGRRFKDRDPPEAVKAPGRTGGRGGGGRRAPASDD
jgi:hypothetical protein